MMVSAAVTLPCAYRRVQFCPGGILFIDMFTRRTRLFRNAVSLPPSPSASLSLSLSLSLNCSAWSCAAGGEAPCWVVVPSDHRAPSAALPFTTCASIRPHRRGAVVVERVSGLCAVNSCWCALECLINTLESCLLFPQ